ncbi:hypothetical protein [Gracilimonas sediminicola]|uniref:Lipoprotein n=1 Tax=Gracilimonas sediminicola TaxID=2952158 RepID=A0A9X2L2T6_9BACT|nr:hypothetical protein [Gracilimonas sediminicola]MCP9291202.1 hypothetical protein [Gracilimonas sediminicola]
MKKTITKVLILPLLVLSLSGCFLKSVHPLFTAEEAILLEGLDGTFENGDQRWTFASDNNPKMLAELIRKYPDEDISFDPGEEDSLKMNAYLILFEETDEPNITPVLFLGKVGKLNGQYYLNLKLFDVDLGMSASPVITHRFNINTFSRIDVQDSKLVMEHLESSWIKDQILNNRVRIKHEVVQADYDDSTEILITASTPELQQFVEKYGDEEDAYQDPLTLKRVPDAVQ